MDFHPPNDVVALRSNQPNPGLLVSARSKYHFTFLRYKLNKILFHDEGRSSRNL